MHSIRYDKSAYCRILYLVAHELPRITLRPDVNGRSRLPPYHTDTAPAGRHGIALLPAASRNEHPLPAYHFDYITGHPIGRYLLITFHNSSFFNRYGDRAPVRSEPFRRMSSGLRPLTERFPAGTTYARRRFCLKTNFHGQTACRTRFRTAFNCLFKDKPFTLCGKRSHRFFFENICT